MILSVTLPTWSFILLLAVSPIVTFIALGLMGFLKEKHDPYDPPRRGGYYE